MHNSRWGDAQDAAQPGHRIIGLMRSSELEPFDGIVGSPERTRPRLFDRIVALDPQLAVLVSQTAKFVALGAAQPVGAPTFISVGLRHPIADRLRRRFKFFRAASG